MKRDIAIDGKGRVQSRKTFGVRQVIFLLNERAGKQKENDAFMEIQFLIFTFFKNYDINNGNFNCR